MAAALRAELGQAPFEHLTRAIEDLDFSQAAGLLQHHQHPEQGEPPARHGSVPVTLP
jgi:hypothetical protein